MGLEIQKCGELLEKSLSILTEERDDLRNESGVVGILKHLQLGELIVQ